MRASKVAYILALVFAAYGFGSLSFIQKFDPSVTWSANFFPRLLFNTLPLFVLGKWSGKTFAPERAGRALSWWFFFFVLICHAAAWIHIWPIALAGHPEILTYVNGANVFLFSCVVAIIAPPAKYAMHYFALVTTLMILPLVFIALESSDSVVLQLIGNDSLLAVFAGLTISAIVHSTYVRVILLELKQMSSTEKFLGKTVSRAIFEGREDLLERRTKKGFILALDIRGYTQMIQSNDAEKAGYFLNTYQAMVSDLVGQYGGFIHKTMGDGHLISFGLMDENDVDLSDIPGIETELRQADARRAQATIARVVLVMDLVAFNTELLAAEMGISAIRLGAGLEYGEVELRVFGDSEYRREFDIFGNTIVRATRLQAHTKALLSHLQAGSSLLIASPIAMHFASPDLREKLCEAHTRDQPVRDCPDLEIIWTRVYEPVIPNGVELFSTRERKYANVSTEDAA